MTAISRRRFLQTATASAGALAFGCVLDAETSPRGASVSFFLVGDTHYLADKEKAVGLDQASAEVTSRLIDTLNKLPGSAIPEAARAGIVTSPRGVIHVGDLIDSGDKSGVAYTQMQQMEWKAWEADWGLKGGDGRLKYPVYELHGNHDAPHGKGLVLDRIIERNKERPGVTNTSQNGLHYSWDWGRVHFLCLGLIVGDAKGSTRKRRYAALDSHDFLVADLASKVGRSGRPVIVLHHVDVARYTAPCDPDAPFGNVEWDPCDVHGFYQALKPYNVAALFYGHTHARNVFRWDGTREKNLDGIPVFNVDNSSHFRSDAQAFFHVEVTDSELLVREYSTRDRWASGAWTPMSWAVPVPDAKPA